MLLLPRKTIVVIGAVVDIALHAAKRPVLALDLADRLRLPRRYLEPALQALGRQGILVGMAGRRGGYRLAKARQAISVYEICEAVETLEAEEPNNQSSWLLDTMALPALEEAEVCFESALKHISVEDLVRAATLQMLARHKPDVQVRETRS